MVCHIPDPLGNASRPPTSEGQSFIRDPSATSRYHTLSSQAFTTPARQLESATRGTVLRGNVRRLKGSVVLHEQFDGSQSGGDALKLGWEAIQGTGLQDAETKCTNAQGHSGKGKLSECRDEMRLQLTSLRGQSTDGNGSVSLQSVDDRQIQHRCRD